MRQFTFDQSTVDQVVAFHGHMCAGTAIGVQAAKLALSVIGPTTKDEDIVAVVETDMCAVDAIQVITGCSIGKGNLIHRDWGKNAYTFYNKITGKGFRLAPSPFLWRQDPEHAALMDKRRAGTATPEDEARFHELHEAWTQRILDTPAEEEFTVTEVDGSPPAVHRLHATVHCEECGEAVSEVSVHRLGGRLLCPPCFDRAYVLA